MSFEESNNMEERIPSARFTLALVLLVLSSGCAFETQTAGAGNGDLYGYGVGDGGVGDGGFDTITPDMTTSDMTTSDMTTSDMTTSAMTTSDLTKPDASNSIGVIVGEGQCTPGTERSSCPGTSCDPMTLTCTTLALASRATCETCFTDSNCADPEHRCVWMTYYGKPFPDETMGFCLRVTDERGTGCPPPFVVPLVNRESPSGGKTQSYCGIHEKLTTCFALRAFHDGRTCPSGRDDECPAGGLCRGLVTQGQKTEYACTYACVDVPECSTMAAKVNCAGFCGG